MLDRVPNDQLLHADNILTDYFRVPVRGRGVIRDRFGRKRRSFAVEMMGSWVGDVYVLREEFHFDNGELQQRSWTLRFTDDTHFEAVCPETVGRARGEVNRGDVHTRYVFRVKIGGRLIALRFDDRIHFLDEGAAINVAVMRKFGIRVAELVLCMKRIGPDS
ncbi:MAG: DUF3833 family protein [Pseudomonadota bacterium]|nr:DUF3833 family protein [Pseudomonadota bacterium]